MPSPQPVSQPMKDVFPKELASTSSSSSTSSSHAAQSSAPHRQSSPKAESQRRAGRCLQEPVSTGGFPLLRLYLHQDQQQQQQHQQQQRWKTPSGSREGTAEQYHRGSPGPSTQAGSACQQPDTLPDSGHANRHKHSADKPKGSRVRPGPHAAVVLVVLIGDGGVSPPWVLWRACICTATPQLLPPSLESQLRLAHASQ
ncbi:unnamed protein product [Gadus morhua 'NCC']